MSAAFGQPGFVFQRQRMDIDNSNNGNNGQINNSSNFGYNGQNNDQNNNFGNNNQGNSGQNNDQNNNFGNNNQGNNGQNNNFGNNNQENYNGQGNNNQNDQGNFLMDSNSDHNVTMNNMATFERLYTPYNGYNATNTCNPVTARLIIFYNDKLFPFLKKYYISSPAGSPEAPTNTLVIEVFIFFFQLIFYQNFYQYNDNEQTWLSNQVNIIENNIIKNAHSLELFKEGTKFADVLDFDKKNKKKEKGPTNNYIYKTVDELFNDQSLSEPLKKLFLNFMEVIYKYYEIYYNHWFSDFKNYFDGVDKNKIINNTENIPTISVNINEYLKPFIDNDTNRRLIDDIIKNIQDADLQEMLEKKYPEISIFIESDLKKVNYHYDNDHNNDTYDLDYTNYFKNRNTWDEIFHENRHYTNIDLDTENANASGVVASQPAPAPAAQQSQPTNDSFIPGETVYVQDDDGKWVQVRITDVHDTEGTADFQLVANPARKGTNYSFELLRKTDPSNSRGGKLTFSNRMKNRRKSLKNFKKGFKRQNRSLKKIL